MVSTRAIFNLGPKRRVSCFTWLELLREASKGQPILRHAPNLDTRKKLTLKRPKAAVDSPLRGIADISRELKSDAFAQEESFDNVQATSKK